MKKQLPYKQSAGLIINKNINYTFLNEGERLKLVSFNENKGLENIPCFKKTKVKTESIYFFNYNILKEYYGFIYKITNLDNNKFYIGKKSFWKTILVKRKKHLTINDWYYYKSSNKTLIEDINSKKHNFKYEIIKLVKTKKLLTYYENQELFSNKVLEIESYNDNISGKFFRRDFK